MSRIGERVFRTYFTCLLMNHFQKLVRGLWRLKRNVDTVGYIESVHGIVDSDLEAIIVMRKN